MLISRVIAEQASLVCSVLNTRWPVSAAWIAVRAVSSSRTSPTMITSGSCRSSVRRALEKVRPDAFLHLELVDQRQVVFDRVFDRADVVLHRADVVQRGVERRRFAAAGRTGHQHDAVGSPDVFQQAAQHVFGEAQVFQVQRNAARVEHADHGLFAAVGGKRAHAQIDLAAFEHHVHAAVLRQAAAR